jgi:hypothetical protein
MGRASTNTGPACSHGIRGRCLVCENDSLCDALRRISSKRPWRKLPNVLAHEMADIADKALEVRGG